MDEQKTNAEAAEVSRTGKPRKKRGYLIGLIVYGMVLLTAGTCILHVLWEALEEYQLTRPETALAAYQENLSAEYAADRGMGVMELTDGYLQSEEECRERILDSLNGEITCLRKGRESTARRLVYALRCGEQVIGEFVMEPQASLPYGMEPWSVTEENFDFSYLMAEPRSVTVPESYTVTVNGRVLTEEYRTETGIHYEQLEAYYGDYPMPGKVTYSFGPLLGQPLVEIADDLGNPVEEGREPDCNRMFNTASEADQAVLEDYTEDLIRHYVAFLGSSKNTRERNYHKLIPYVEKGSNLARRLFDALDGLQYGWSVKDKLATLVTHYRMEVEENLWLCDITYEVDTTGQKGVVRTVTNARLLIVGTDYGPKLRSIEVY